MEEYFKFQGSSTNESEFSISDIEFFKSMQSNTKEQLSEMESSQSLFGRMKDPWS